MHCSNCNKLCCNYNFCDSITCVNAICSFCVKFCVKFCRLTNMHICVQCNLMPCIAKHTVGELSTKVYRTGHCHHNRFKEYRFIPKQKFDCYFYFSKRL